MATAGEGAAAQSASAYEGVGLGGKFRKRPFRRTQTTPYDRPPTALRNPSWLSKLVVDPASKLLAAGAQRFFSSVFRKRLPPPPHPPRQLPEEKQESRNVHQETVPDNCAGTQEPADVVGGSSTCKNDTGGISELEQLLKQKTFTRSEIDRLSELLHSRAVDLPVKEDGKRSEANLSIQNNFSKPMSDTGMHQEFPVHLEGNKIEKVRAHGAVSTPTASKKLLEDEIASPAELAKAYMGSNPLKVSPSTLGLPSQIAREDAGLLINSPFISKPPMKSLAVKTTGHVGIPGNGFTTPRSRGRTAIYNMARTPYSRLHPTPVQKVSGSGNYGYSRPSSSASQSAWDIGVQNGSKPVMQALKRRSSVLDDDIGSVGPVRRIRQKPNLLSHGISLPSRGMSLGSDAFHFHKLPLMDETKNRASNTPSTSYAHVPPESSEMAARIFEHLEKMTPKEKSSESKLATARERSSFKLTPNMLRGQALRSLEDLDASKLLQNSQNGHKLGDQPISSLPDSRDFTTQKQGRVEENGPATFVHPVDKLSPVVNTDNTVTPRDIKLSTEDAVAPNFIPQSSERKRGFKMSAHEDSLELDDDVPLNEPASESDKGRGMAKSIMDSKSIPSEGKTLDKMPVPSEVRIDPVPVLSKITELDASSAPMAGEEHTGFTFSLSHASAKRSQSALLSQSALAPAKPTTSGDSPLFVSFGSKTRESVHSTDSKAESSSSLMNVFGATDAKVPESDKSNTKSSQLLDSIVNGQSGVVPSLASNSTSMISIFSAGAPFSNLVSNNGPLASSASMLSSSSAPVSSKLSNQNFTNSSSNMVSPVGTTTISINGSTTSTSAASDSGLFVATMAPSISSAPVFNFRSSKDPLTASSAASTTANAETTDLKVNAEKDNSFGKGNSSFGSMSFAAASTGSSIFGLDSFVSSAAANSQLQGSVTASGSVVSTQPPSTGSGIATVSQSVPVQFGSSSSPMVFGASGVASFTSSSIFGSSAAATSAQSFSASTSETNLVNSSSGGAPSIVKFGVGSSASEVNAISSSSTATPGTFTFGVSSAASSSPSSSVTPGFFSFGASSSASSSATTSGSTVPGMFSFGAGSTVSSSVTSSSTTPGIFSFGASSSGSSSPANAVTSSSGTAPGVFSFGVSNPASSSAANSVSSGGASSSSFGWQAPESPIFGSTLNTTSPSTGFSFGASSSSFGATNSSPMVFGSTTGTSSNPVFSFSAAPGTTFSLPSSSTPTVFGNSTSPFAASPGNNDQMNTEDSMAEDPVQSSTSAAPVFGQSPVSPSPQGFMFGWFMFGSTVPSPAAAVPFQFGGQQNQAVPQNPLPFQQSSPQGFMFGSTVPSLVTAVPFQFGGQLNQAIPQNPLPFQQSSSQGFMFGSTVPSPAAAVVPFQFGGQQNQAVPQNPLPFQQSSNLEFKPGGSFSLGNGGGDKSGRKIVKVNRNRNKKR